MAKIEYPMKNDLLHEYFKVIHKGLNTFEFKLDSKNRIYIPLFLSSIEHCMSIHFLDKENLKISMYALVRPAVENYLRAMWVKCCVDIDEIDDNLSNMHFPKNIKFMMSEIEGKTSSFTLIKEKFEPLIENMHDFTHGGIQSITRQYGDGDMLTNFRDEGEIRSIINLSILVSSLSYSEAVIDNIGSELLELEKVNELAIKIMKL